MAEHGGTLLNDCVSGVLTLAGVIHRTPVRSEASATAVRRLETFVARMERRYERTSAEMAREVREGRTPETREVGKWLAEYHLLTRLRAAQEAGSDSRNTG